MIRTTLIAYNGQHPALAQSIRELFFDRVPTTTDVRDALAAPDDLAYIELLSQVEVGDLLEATEALDTLGVVTLECSDHLGVVGAVVLEHVELLTSSALQVG